MPNGDVISVSDGRVKADVPNSFFTEQTSLINPPSTFPDLSALYADGSVADTLSTTPAEVFDVLTHLKPGKAPGWMRFHRSYFASVLVAFPAV